MIATTIRGGLGNQMFMYAMARAMSLRNKTSMAFNLHEGFEKDFQFHRKLELQNLNVEMGERAPFTVFDYKGACFTQFLSKKVGRNIVVPQYRIIKEDVPMHFQPELVDKCFKNVYLEGYWQSEKYFGDFREQIRKDFEIVTPIADNVKAELNEMQQGGHNLVFIGVRRYQECKQTRSGMVLNADYYNKAIKCIEGRVSNLKFIVFTQQPEWAKQHLIVKSPIMFAQHKTGELSTIEDLFLMTQCRHAIISNSSFYWWGAWLMRSADKIVIAPNNFINIDSPCEGWIKL